MSSLSKEARKEIIDTRLEYVRNYVKGIFRSVNRKLDNVVLEALARSLIYDLYVPHLFLASTEDLVDELKRRCTTSSTTSSTLEEGLPTGVIMDGMLIRNYYHCESAENWSTQVEGSKGGKYTVRWDANHHKNKHQVEYDYSCTCKAYIYRSGYCKHIQQVIGSKERCGWMQFTEGGHPDKFGGGLVCPECGSPVRMRGWAV